MKTDPFDVRPTLRFIADESIAPRAAQRGVRDAAPRWLQRIAALLQAWRESRRARAIRASIGGLDAATLRDLGISRSEIGSIDAEWRGRVQLTRRRIVRAHHEVPAPEAPRASSADYYR